MTPGRDDLDPRSRSEPQRASSTAAAAWRADRAAVRGLATGLVLMAVFTLMWGWWTAQGLGVVALVTVPVFTGMAAVFLVHGLRALRALHHSPAVLEDSVAAAGSTVTGRRFGVVVVAEAAAIVVASTWLGATGHSRYVNPVIALVVGLHFLALMAVFPTQRTVNLATGSVLSASGAGGILLLADRLLPTDLVWSLVAVVAASCTSAQGLAMLALHTVAGPDQRVPRRPRPPP